MDFPQALQRIEFVTREGLTLRGWQTKLRGKPILYFRHGNGLSCLSYRAMLAELVSDFDLMLLDTQGHGDSDDGSPLRRWNDCAEHAVEHISQTRSQWGDVPLYGIGHSFGAILTLQAAASSAGLFDHCVLLDPVIFPLSWRPFAVFNRLPGAARYHPMARKALRRRTHWADKQAAFDSLYGRGGFTDWPKQALRDYIDDAMYEDASGVHLKCSPQHEAHIFTTATGPLWTRLYRLRTPTTIITGANTYHFVYRSARLAAAIQPHIKHRVVAGGHFFMQEHPQATARHIRLALGT